MILSVLRQRFSKLLFATLLFVIPYFCTSVYAQTNSSTSRIEFARLPLIFEPNLGQADSGVRFVSKGLGYNLSVTDHDATLSMDRSGQTPAQIQMKWVGGNAAAQVVGTEKLASHSGYSIGADSSKWIPNVPHFGKVRLEQVYKGVDLVYYGNAGTLEYDFLVAPHVDPRVIQLAFEGAESVEIGNNGDLELQIAGEQFTLQQPVAYQEIGGSRQMVDASFRIDGNQHVHFDLGSYDPSFPLVIDPTIQYFSFFSGGYLGNILGIAIDSSAFPAVYVAGYLTNRNVSDVYIAKFDNSLNLLWSHTYGGSSNDQALGIALDGNSNVYVVGSTNSTDFITRTATTNDGFVLKLNGADGNLLLSTLLGFTTASHADAIQFYSSDIYVAGVSSGSSFVKKLNAATLAVDPTFSPNPIGGMVERGNIQPSIYEAIDSSTSPVKLYVAGSTTAQTCPLPLLLGAVCNLVGLGTQDAFVAEINLTTATTGSSAHFSYVGGAGTKTGGGVAVDSNGDVYVVGDTTAAGSKDAFVARFDSNLGIVGYESVGGSDIDTANAISLSNSSAKVLIAGSAGATSSDPIQRTDFPTWGGGDNFDGGSSAFITQYNKPFPSNGSRTRNADYTTSIFVGDPAPSPATQSSGMAMAVDGNSNIFLAGVSSKQPFISKIVPIDLPGISSTTLNPSTVDLNGKLSGDLLSTGTVVLSGPMNPGTSIQVSPGGQDGQVIYVNNIRSSDQRTWLFDIRFNSSSATGGGQATLYATVGKETCVSSPTSHCQVVLSMAGAASIGGIALNQAQIVAGNSTDGHLTVTGNPTIPVVISSDHPLVALIGALGTIPGTGSVSLAANTTSVPFTVRTLDAGTNAITSVDIKATLGTSSPHISLTVVPNLLLTDQIIGTTVIHHLAISGIANPISGQTQTATVSLNAAVPTDRNADGNYVYGAGVQFTLQATDANGVINLADVNGNTTFNIPPGASSLPVTFVVPMVTSPTGALVVKNITASIQQSILTNPSTSTSIPVSITPLKVTGVTWGTIANPLYGPGTVSASIQLNNTTFVGSVPLALSTSPVLSGLPTSFSATSSLPGIVNVSIPFSAVSTDTTYTVTASLNGSTAPLSGTTTAPTFKVSAYSTTLTLPATIASGGTGSGTLVFAPTSAAPSSANVTWTVSPSTTGFTLPASVTFTAGTASFQITAPTVATATPYTLTATVNGISSSKVITVSAATASMTLPTTLASGATGSGSFTFNPSTAAPGGSASITWTGNTTGFTLPATATFANGTATISPITAPTVTTQTTFSLTATINGISATASIAVTPITTTLTLPATIASGAAGSGAIAFSPTSAAPSSPASVTWTVSPSTAGFTLPTSVTFTAGTASFQITAPTVATATSYTLTATVNGSSSSKVITVSAATASMTLPTTLANGATGSGSITFNPTTAVAIGVPVTVTWTGNTAGFTLPTSVTFAANGTATIAPITAPTVTTPTTFNLTATINGISATASIAVTPITTTLTLPATIASGATGSGTLVFVPTSAAPSTATVTWTVSPSTTGFTLPVSVTFTSGTASFQITAPTVATATSYTLTATVNGVSSSKVITVSAATASMTLPATLANGATGSGSITFNPTTAVAIGVPVAVTWTGNTTSFTLPTSVTFAANGTATIAPITAPIVTTPTTFNLTATINGISATASIAVTPITTTLTLPATIASGATGSGTLVFAPTSAAPSSANVTWTVSPSTTGFTLPASVTFTSGTASFQITAPTVATATPYTLTATVNGISSSKVITVSAATASMTLPATLASGATGSGSFTFSPITAAPGGSASITWTGNTTGFTLPATATFASGTATISPIKAPTVTTTTTFNLTATINGISATASVQVLVSGTTTTIPFKPNTFIADVNVGLKRGADNDTFLLRGEFSLGDTSNGINPVTEPVTLKIGPYSVVIPANSFKLSGDRDGDGDLDRHGCHAALRYRFKGVINGVSLDVRIRSFGHNEYDIRAEGKNTELTGIVKNVPVTIQLTIGADSGTTTDSSPKVRAKYSDADVDVDLSWRDGHDTFHVDVDLTLDDSTDGANPVLEPVVFKMGAYGVTIPAHAFKLDGDTNGDGIVDRTHQNSKQTFRYSGTIDGVSLDATIHNYGNNQWDMSVDGKRADLDDILNGSPITVKVAIGNDSDEVVDSNPRLH